MVACGAEDQLFGPYALQGCPDGCGGSPRSNAFAGQEQRGLGQVEVFGGFGWVQVVRRAGFRRVSGWSSAGPVNGRHPPRVHRVPVG